MPDFEDLQRYALSDADWTALSGFFDILSVCVLSLDKDLMNISVIDPSCIPTTSFRREDANSL